MTAEIDVRAYFTTVLPAALAANVKEARAINARYQFVIPGPAGGEWTVDLTAAGPSCKPGRAAASCTFTLSDDTFRELCVQPEKSAVRLYMAGKLRVEGDIRVALKIGTILSLVNLPKQASVTAAAVAKRPSSVTR